jgi:nicotinamidase-related amidase
MAVRLDELLDPARAALVTCECQNGVLGEAAVFPALAEAARAAGLVRHVGDLVSAARTVGVPVLHCLALRRADGLGASGNARLFAAAAKTPVPLTPGSAAAAPHPGIGADPGRDLLLPRLHGLGPFQDTGLATALRNLGARTVVCVGVSLNVALLELVLGAVGAGFQVVLPRRGRHAAGVRRGGAAAHAGPGRHGDRHRDRRRPLAHDGHSGGHSGGHLIVVRTNEYLRSLLDVSSDTLECPRKDRDERYQQA